MTRGDPRSTSRWQRVRLAVLAGATVCARCGLPLQPNARPRSRWSSSVDHLVPLAWGGDPYDPAGLVAVHYGCNSRAGARIALGRSGPARRSPQPPVQQAQNAHLW